MSSISLDHLPPRLLRVFLDLPLDRPFTTCEALTQGATFPDLRALVRSGHLTRPVRGVYATPSFDDDLRFRIDVLKLVVPPLCVVTDQTAGWVWGANMILAPNDHLVTPPVSVFCPPGSRLRSGLVASGERMLAPRDVVDVGGLRVTTPLRTACDLGRLLHRDRALAALDSLTALGSFGLEELILEVQRFRGFRGVVQLRTLVLIVDPRAQSPGESALRLRWYDAGLPRPECQVEVETPWGTPYLIDIGLSESRFGAEYDGEEFHGAEQEEHDTGRRLWLKDEGGWQIVVARRQNVYGHFQDAERLLRAGYDTLAH